jgi:hypothetical protein
MNWRKIDFLRQMYMKFSNYTQPSKNVRRNLEKKTT